MVLEHEKYFYNQSSHYKNTKSLIIEASAPVGWVCRSIMLYHYSSFPATLKTLDNIPSK